MATLEMIDLAECQKNEHSRLAALPEHAWRLKEILEEPEVAGGFLEEDGRFRDVAAWLTCAAGLTGIAIDCGRYSGASYMCRGAAEWDAARSDELMAVTGELTRVMFIWNALERAGRALQLAAPHGMAAALATYVNAHVTPQEAPAHHVCVVRTLRLLVPPDDKNFSGVRRILRGDDAGVTVGLRAGTKLRNLLVHGVVKLPPAEIPGTALQRQIALAQTTSRALLFGLQMILRVDARLRSPDISVYEPGSGAELPLDDVLNVAHLVV